MERTKTVPIGQELADRYRAAAVEYSLCTALLPYLSPGTDPGTQDEIILKTADAKGDMDDALQELYELAYAHGATQANGETIRIYPDANNPHLKITNAGGKCYADHRKTP